MDYIYDNNVQPTEAIKNVLLQISGHRKKASKTERVTPQTAFLDKLDM